MNVKCLYSLTDVELCKLLHPTGYFYVKCKCIPEQRQNADKYDVMVAMATDGAVVSAWCTCVAGWVKQSK